MPKLLRGRRRRAQEVRARNANVDALPSGTVCWVFTGLVGTAPRFAPLDRHRASLAWLLGGAKWPCGAEFWCSDCGSGCLGAFLRCAPDCTTLKGFPPSSPNGGIGTVIWPLGTAKTVPRTWALDTPAQLHAEEETALDYMYLLADQTKRSFKHALHMSSGQLVGPVHRTTAAWRRVCSVS